MSSANIDERPIESVPDSCLEKILPDWANCLNNPQTDIPKIAKDKKLVAEIESILQEVPTEHRMVHADSRSMNMVQPASVHLHDIRPAANF